MSHARRRLRTSALAAIAVLVSVRLAGAAGFVDPALHFRTLATPHFIIYFHQGEETSARRLAVIAEDTWQALARPLAVQPPALTHVILADQTELANGWAIPVPYNTIFITATWPSGAETIGFTEDWLQVAFTHEFTHIVHLDRSEGWARVVRHAFGRVPIAFPNLLLPLWQIEGLAVYEESVLTGEGRLHAGDFLALEETARRQHALDPIDRVNGGLTRWPDGSAPYLYGGPFTEFLAERYGAGTIGRLAEATARRLPYTSSRAFKTVYGKSLGDLWKEFEARPATSSGGVDSDHATQVTRHGFFVGAPRFLHSACAGCADQVIYSLDTPDGFPSLNIIGVDGTRDREVAKRYLGSTSSVHGDIVVFDQDDIHRNAGLYSDLYALDLATGSVRALTSEARLRDPDVSPDGTTIAAVRDANGERDLVLLAAGCGQAPPRDLATWRAAQGSCPVTVLAHGPATQYDAPRWSPDGLSIAVARHALGSQSDIVIVDVASSAIRVIASGSNTRFVTPAWKPDGKAVIAAGASGGEPFNLVEVPLDGGTPVQLTHSSSGAIWPDVSADGNEIVYVGYTKDGYDLFVMAYPQDTAASPAGLTTRATTSGPAATGTGADTGRYSPWPTLKPTSWMPFLDSEPDQFRAGAVVQGQDVLGYHSYALAATWLVSAHDGAASDGRGLPDWSATYLYARWRPTFFATAGRQTSFFAGPPADDGTPTNVTSHQFQFQGGVELPFIHTRRSDVFLASIVRASDTYTFPQGDITVDRTALRGGWEANTSHLYGRSISQEDGVELSATIESVRKSLGSYADATTITGESRAYISGPALHHVIALRAGAGASSGNNIVGQTFLSGGPGPSEAPLSFDARAFSLLRGFAADTFAGSRIAAGTAEYRFPLAWPERGHGTFPLFLSSLSGAVFVDAANTWTRTFRAANTKTAIGAEVSAGVVAGYVLPLTFTAGAARGHDGAGRIADSTTFYLRLGRAF